MDYFNSHILFRKHNKVRKLCLPLETLGIIGFIYMRRYQDGKFIDLSNQLDWASYFLNKYINGQYAEGTIEHQMLQEEGTLFWSSEPNNIAWKEAAEIFNFGNGISIFRKIENYYEVFCFYGKSDDYFLNKIYSQSFHILDKFSRYFVENMTEEILNAYDKNDLLLTPDKYMSSTWKFLTEDKEEQFMREIKKLKNKTILTPREQHCVFLSSCGKTAKEIARCSTLSPRTVETHLANAKRKLGCRNLQEIFYKLSGNSNFLNSNDWQK